MGEGKASHACVFSSEHFGPVLDWICNDFGWCERRKKEEEKEKEDVNGEEKQKREMRNAAKFEFP